MDDPEGLLSPHGTKRDLSLTSDDRFSGIFFPREFINGPNPNCRPWFLGWGRHGGIRESLVGTWKYYGRAMKSLVKGDGGLGNPSMGSPAAAYGTRKQPWPWSIPGGRLTATRKGGSRQHRTTRTRRTPYRRRWRRPAQG